MEAIRRIRNNEKQGIGGRSESSPQYVIGLSAFSDAETIQEALTSGMDDFITKPLTMPNLKLALEKRKLKQLKRHIETSDEPANPDYNEVVSLLTTSTNY